MPQTMIPVTALIAVMKKLGVAEVAIDRHAAEEHDDTTALHITTDDNSVILRLEQIHKDTPNDDETTSN